MTVYRHKIDRIFCPFLPLATEELRPSQLKALKAGHNREKYYREALRCAQSLWLCGLPAQALLQLNLALGESFTEGESVLEEWPLPYRSKVWMFENYREGEFLGNPVRHYQHLASRIQESPLRALRAWACFHIASRILHEKSFPRDEGQILKESLEIPTLDTILTRLGKLHRPLEVSLIKDCL